MTRIAASAALGILLIGARPIARGDVIVLKPGAAVEQDISGTAIHEYDIDLKAGEYAGLTIDQRGTDLAIRILDTSGVAVALVDDELRKDAREQATIVADTARAYRLTVSARYPLMASGRYAIWIDEIRPATQRDRDLFEARKLGREAATLRIAGKFDDSQARATKAVSLAEAAVGQNHLLIASLLATIGQNYRSKGQSDEAEQAFKRAIASAEGAGGPDHPEAGFARETLGVQYTTLGDYAKAEPLIADGTAVVQRALGEHPLLATCLRDFALFHSLRGDPTHALAELQHALQITDKTVSPDEFGAISIVNNLGDLYVKIKDYDRAQPLVERAVRDLERTLGPDNYRVSTPLLNLAIIARERGDYATALVHLQRAYDIREKAYGRENSEPASLLISIGNTYLAQKNYPAALAAYQQSYDVLDKTAGPYHNFTLLAINGLARALAASGDLKGAIERRAAFDERFDRTIAFNMAIGSEREKLTFLKEQTLERMGRTISLHLQMAPDNGVAANLAASAILHRKGRVLDATLDARRMLRSRLEPDDQALFDQLSTVTSELATMALNGPGRTPPADYQKKFADLDARRETLESDISRRSAPFRDETRDITLEDVRAAVPAGSALVEFIVYQPFDATASTDAAAHGELRYAAYVIRPDADARGVDLGPAKTIDAQVTRLRAALRDPARQDVKSLARMLDDAVLRRVRALTGTSTHLLVAPDGALNLIPFEALVDERGRYAVQRYEITYLAGGRDLLRMKEPHRTAGAPLVVADPAFGGAAPADGSGAETRAAGTYFAPLGGTSLEAAAIQKVLPRATVLTGTRATKSALTEAASPSILHIASHAFFREGGTAISDPLLRAGIALAGANERQGEGILTGLEATTLHLDGTKLVTLSACDTGLGEVRNVEGVYGLRRAFFLAGSESLVMSLWPVSDFVTRRAMTDLYAGLAHGLGRGAALRRVQLAMLTDPQRKHPYYWAAFIEAGDWTPLK